MAPIAARTERMKPIAYSMVNGSWCDQGDLFVMPADTPKRPPRLRPMSEFDPSKPAMVHDQLNRDTFE